MMTKSWLRQTSRHHRMRSFPLQQMRTRQFHQTNSCLQRYQQRYNLRFPYRSQLYCRRCQCHFQQMRCLLRCLLRFPRRCLQHCR